MVWKEWCHQEDAQDKYVGRIHDSVQACGTLALIESYVVHYLQVRKHARCYYPADHPSPRHAAELAMAENHQSLLRGV